MLSAPYSQRIYVRLTGKKDRAWIAGKGSNTIVVILVLPCVSNAILGHDTSTPDRHQRSLFFYHKETSSAPDGKVA